jgi:hypothetical protein
MDRPIPQPIQELNPAHLNKQNVIVSLVGSIKKRKISPKLHKAGSGYLFIERFKSIPGFVRKSLKYRKNIRN